MILHDLGVLQPGSLANALLVFVPVLLWIGAALLVRVPRPLLTLLVIGAAYGVLLALCHQLLWGRPAPGRDRVWAGTSPTSRLWPTRS